MTVEFSNTNKQQLGSAKCLYKATRASEAMRQVKEACEFMIATPKLPWNVRSTLWTGILCTYARPFGDNETVGSWRAKVPDRYRKKHEILIRLRQAFAAHSNPQVFTQKDGFGANRVFLKKRGTKWSSHSVQIAPPEDLLCAIRDLAQELYQEADEQKQKYLDLLHIPSSGWPDGDYGLELSPKPGQPVVVQIPRHNPEGVVGEAVSEVYTGGLDRSPARLSKRSDLNKPASNPKVSLEIPAERLIP